MSVCKQDGSENVWVFRLPNEKWDQECFEPVNNGSRVTKMFWGCFAGNRRGGLTSLEPDPDRTGKKGITGLIILDAYKEHLPTMLDDDSGIVFMQDGAKTHKIRETMDWFKEKGYTVMDWPAYSPDLNPIEMVWKKVKNIVFRRHPELRILSASAPKIQEALLMLSWRHGTT